MACRVLAAWQFESDYGDVLEYLVEELKAPHAAARFMEDVEHAVERLADFPEMNAVSRKSELQRLEYREQLVGNYVILYAYRENTVALARMFHQSQDYERFFVQAES